MITCQNCGQQNAVESQFCRFCGTKFIIQPTYPQQQQAPPQYDYQAPKPYGWKTDEYQTQAGARQTSPVNAQYGAQPLATRDPQYMTGNYRCPHCMSQFLPRIERRMSTTGWVVFGVLLVLFFPLFWVGFLIKEDVHICPSCNTRVK